MFLLIKFENMVKSEVEILIFRREEEGGQVDRVKLDVHSVSHDFT